MTDYIKREDAARVMAILMAAEAEADGYPDAPIDNYIEYALEDLEDIPSADVAPVRHGHWIIECVRKYELSDGGTAYVPEYKCSWCGFTTESYVRLDEPIMPEDADFPNYCEYCGAKMDGGEGDV